MLNNNVNLLVEQHNAIKDRLDHIASSIEGEGSYVDHQNVFTEIIDLSSKLQEHLVFENEVYYPALLAALEKKSIDIGATKLFIAEMGSIIDYFMDFLQKYDKIEKIQSSFEMFKFDFNREKNAIDLRINLEQDTVFSFFPQE